MRRTLLVVELISMLQRALGAVIKFMKEKNKKKSS